ncbi:hypothetical protein RUND412_003233 [Rhizina undulata]
MPPSPAFVSRKSRILAEISSPTPDASPKGTIDVQIIPLMEKLNQHERVVTTSSCSGRVSVFLEGVKKDTLKGSAQSPLEAVAEGPLANAGIGGKGEGGKWLYVSHDPVDISGKASDEVSAILFGGGPSGEADDAVNGIKSGRESLEISSSTRLVHIKFEPMILHVLTSDLEAAHALLNAGLAAGFRESGIMNPGLGNAAFPILAIRCHGLVMDSIIGVFDNVSGKIIKMVDDSYLEVLIKICNLRFEDNKRRIDALSAKIDEVLFGVGKEKLPEWEDKAIRKARKREDGLRKQRELMKTSAISPEENAGENTRDNTENPPVECIL